MGRGPDVTVVRWGVLAPGRIARRFAAALPETESGSLHAVASRETARARAFADEFGAERVHRTYEDLLADPDVDAVYIAAPHTEHARWTIAALDAGKAVLCEKPLTAHPAHTMVVLESAHVNERLLLEAYMYRFHPQIAFALEAVAAGRIGTLQHIEASFAFSVPPDDGRLFDPDLAGGGILDVGGYPLSFVRFAMRAAGAVDTAPRFDAAGSVGDDGVDEWATASLRFDEGITAQVTCGIRNRDENRVRIFGSRGVLTIAHPWVVAAGDVATVELRIVGEEPHVQAFADASPYAREADAVSAALARGARETPEVTWADSAVIATWQARWREAIGARYARDAVGVLVPPVAGRLQSASRGTMPRGRVPGVSKDISRLVLGCDNQTDPSHAAAMFDDFVERGGNAFDTAFTYGRGLQEKLLGSWMEARGIRDDVVVIGKGAHTPYCDPDSVGAELVISLERLRTDHVDLYFLHRDNPQIPVAEFVDALDEHVRAGRIRAFGGSNWTTARMDEANAYAAATGKQGFAALSNHFGLARAQELPWKGCEHATDAASKAWLARTGMPLFPWSSQARGFFSRADPRDRSDEQLVRCYYVPDNFERLTRTRTLADRLGVQPTAIALAYVLAQDFPTFPLIGPRSVAETRTSLEALAVDLTVDDVRFLDLTPA